MALALGGVVGPVGALVRALPQDRSGCRSIGHGMAGRVRLGKLNVDENPITAQRFDVRGIPCLLVIKAGREIDRIVGVQPKPAIARRHQRLLARA